MSFKPGITDPQNVAFGTTAFNTSGTADNALFIRNDTVAGLATARDLTIEPFDIQPALFSHSPRWDPIPEKPKGDALVISYFWFVRIQYQM